MKKSVLCIKEQQRHRLAFMDCVIPQSVQSEHSDLTASVTRGAT